MSSQWANRPLNPARLAAIEKYAGKSVLDVGCGNGAYVLQLDKDRRAEGVDREAYSSWQPSAELFQVAEASQLPHQPESVDTLLCFEVLEHLDNPAEALKEFHRVCRNTLILSVPNCELSSGMESSRLAYYHYTDRTHRNFFTLESVSNLVESAGFSVVSQQLVNPVNLLPFMAEALPWKLGSIIAKLFPLREYNMTCLLVAKKRQS